MKLEDLINVTTFQGDIRLSLWKDGEETKVKEYSMVDDLSFMNVPAWARNKEVNYIFCGVDGYLHIELEGD